MNIRTVRDLLNRVYFAIVRRIYKLYPADYRVFKVQNGLKMKLNPKNAYDYKMIINDYDPVLIQLIKEVVKDGDNCFDIGAQMGYVSLQLAKAVGKNGMVFSFEPDSNARIFLDNNININKLTNIKVIPNAIGENNESKCFYISNIIGWSTFAPNELAKDKIITKKIINTVSIDELYENQTLKGKITFIKLDVEGYELSVLKGMNNFFKKERPVIHCEINKPSLTAANESPVEIFNILKKLGYEIYIVELENVLGRLKYTNITKEYLENNKIFNIVAIIK